MKTIFRRRRKVTTKVEIFENACTVKQGVRYSRYVASWINAGGSLKYQSDIDNFKEWLKTMGLSNGEICNVVTIAICGKSELEHSAKAFLEH